MQQAWGKWKKQVVKSGKRGLCDHNDIFILQQQWGFQVEFFISLQIIQNERKI